MEAVAGVGCCKATAIVSEVLGQQCTSQTRTTAGTSGKPFASFSNRACQRQHSHCKSLVLHRRLQSRLKSLKDSKSSPPWKFTSSRNGSCARAATEGEGNGWESADSLGVNTELQAQLEQLMLEGDAPKLMEKLETAENRVLKAEAARKFLEEKMAQVATLKAELARASEEQELLEADEGVVAAARQVAEAEAEVAYRRAAVLKARARKGSKWNTPGVDEDKERVESGRSAAIAAATGLAVSLPVVLAGWGPASSLVSEAVSEGAIVVTCALFGVCYRYMVRRDTQNTQLKAGVVGAFGLTRGLAQVATSLQLAGPTPAALETVLKSALDAGQSLIVLGFTAAALDYCMQSGRLNPFPSTDPVEHDQKT